MGNLPWIGYYDMTNRDITKMQTSNLKLAYDKPINQDKVKVNNANVTANDSKPVN